MTQSPLHQRLRDETQPVHEALEAQLCLDSSWTAYVGYLQKMLAFHGPLEQRMQNSALYRAFLPDAALRVRMPALLSDLAMLGVAPAAQRPVAVPTTDDLAQLVGVAYVLEGSTLGGQVISRRVATRLGIGPEARAYVGGYGELTFDRWRSFLTQLGALEFDAEQQAEAVTAAKETFLTLRDWLTRGSEVASKREPVHGN